LWVFKKTKYFFCSLKPSILSQACSVISTHRH
jgi:hypothetical protein